MTSIRRRRPVAGHAAPPTAPSVVPVAGPAAGPAESLRSHAALIGEMPRLRRYATAWLGNAGAADGLVQDTIRRVIAQDDALDEPQRLRIRLLRLLHDLHEGDLDRPRRDGPFAGPASLGRDLSDTRGGGARASELMDAIGQLSDERRRALLLIALERLGYREAADVLGLPLGTLMSRLAGAREEVLTLSDGGDVEGPDRSDSAAAAIRSGVSELDLHAYLDGELSAERVEAVEAFLSSHPEQAERLARFTQREEMIRKSYDPILHRPLPPELLTPFFAAPARPVEPRRRLKLATAAATVLLLLLGFVAGWLLRSHLTPAGIVIPWVAG